jgi:glycerophosphoryl diester phosphodiesterase
MRKILNIGHRGARGTCGEDNTLRSYACAIEVGCDLIELDVRCTADGALVCFHDDEAAGVAVNKLSHPELCTRTGLAVPTLAEALAVCRGRVRLDVEIKAPGYEAEVAAALASWPPEDALVSSFDLDILAACRAVDPQRPRGLLLAPEARGPHASATALATARDLGAAVLLPHVSLVSHALVAEADARGLATYTWTVNEPAAMQRCRALGVAGIVTDYPDRLAALE